MAPEIPKHNVVYNKSCRNGENTIILILLSPSNREKKDENPGRRTTYFEDHLTSLADRSPAEIFCFQRPKNQNLNSIMEFLKRPRFSWKVKMDQKNKQTKKTHSPAQPGRKENYPATHKNHNLFTPTYKIKIK